MHLGHTLRGPSLCKGEQHNRHWIQFISITHMISHFKSACDPPGSHAVRSEFVQQWTIDIRFSHFNNTAMPHPPPPQRFKSTSDMPGTHISPRVWSQQKLPGWQCPVGSLGVWVRLVPQDWGASCWSRQRRWCTLCWWLLAVLGSRGWERKKDNS